ncbi:GMC family oxidoreductase [Kangiella sp. TOML190]|uniref:GMC family oxidoreductase n=1 Tax=Kangiella sp. TOML190 TaxID=2931351 RepID=UPI0020425C71|nr:GMC family oxidoreductase [Kangiella sp. TOML190]
MIKNDPQAIDANQLGSRVLETDIAIIGSGAGGGVSAEIFAKQGFRVLLLEEGPYLTARDFKMQEKEAYPLLYQESAARKTKDKAINILQGRSVGGSTTVNWTSSFRTPDKTLAHWQKHYGLADLSPDKMAPWFEKMEQRLNIAPWATPANANNDAISRGAKKLGWSARTIARNVKGCANLGYCGMGCLLNAKQSMLVSTIPAAKKLGAKVLYQARVERLLIEADKVVGCEVYPVNHASKRTHNAAITIKAKHTILSAGSIGSPAVLLRSKVPDPFNRVGKRTFLHPVVASAAFMPHQVNGFYGAPQSIYSDEFLWPKANKMGFKIEAAPLHPSLVSTVLTPFSEQHFDLFKDFSKIQGSLALLRDGFSEDSQGGQVWLDKFGYPKLDYPLNDYFWTGARSALLAMAELQFAAGAKSVYPSHMDAKKYPSWHQANKAIKQFTMKELKTMVFSAHLMGGNAMGADDKLSVVDEQGKFRWLDGLHIFDGSIFPTSIGANPQLSIYGLVAKLATNLSTQVSKRASE